MRKIAVLPVLLLVIVVSAGSVFAGEYDRYEREYPVYTGDTSRPSTSESLPPSPQPRAALPPPQTHMHHGPGYFSVQLGVYEPNNGGYNGLATYDSGFSLNVIFGSRLTPFFAVEGSVGYFGSESSFYRGDLSVVPVTVGGRLIIPNPVVEPYVGAGVGIYFASIDEKRSGIKDDVTDIGGYLSLGVDFWLTPKVALNMEGRYQRIKPKLDGCNINLSGWNTLLGVKVSF